MLAPRTTTRLSVIAGMAAVLAPLLGVAPAQARPASDYEMPFPCGQRWTGDTRSSHSPSPLSLDFNRPDDLGDRVTASAAGVVSRVERLGSRSYGTYVVLDHGGGESTLYAHLQQTWLVPGQRVDQGALVGLLGGTGNVTGPHLHYEQRLDGRDREAWFHGAAYSPGTARTSANCSDTAVAGDWDGDGRTDVGVFRRKSTARFRMAQPGGGTVVQRLGQGTDQPLVGDWDGDGRDEIGVRRPLTSTFILQRADGSRTRITYGAPGDQGVAGDWDGNGRADVGVWRPSSATFLLRRADGRTDFVPLGGAGSVPVTGDWNGDRRTDLGAFSPTTGSWALRMVGRDGTVWSASVPFGTSADLPVTGDWDGDGVTDLGVWTPATAAYTLRTADPLSKQVPQVVTRRFGQRR